MFGCSARRATAAGCRLTPVKTVTLYRITGTGEVSAVSV
jgi:hypothetical protein